MIEWFLIVTIFGEMVYERGPFTADICADRASITVRWVDAKAISGDPIPEFNGKVVARADVEVKCVKKVD